MRPRVRADVTVHMLPVSVHIADSLQFDLTSLAVISNSGNFTSFFWLVSTSAHSLNIVTHFRFFTPVTAAFSMRLITEKT